MNATESRTHMATLTTFPAIYLASLAQTKPSMILMGDLARAESEWPCSDALKEEEREIMRHAVESLDGVAR